MKQSMKSLIGAGVYTISSLTAGSAAYATTNDTQNSWYVGASGDLTWLRHSKVGGGGNLDLGHQFNDFRAEAEAGYHRASGKAGFNATHYFTYMGNVYYDFNRVFPSSGSGWHVTPYVGAGLGDAALHSGTVSFRTTFRHHEDSFAYQGMAGLTFVSASMPNTDWSLGYRYLGTDKDNLHANNLELGVRFHF